MYSSVERCDGSQITRTSAPTHITIAAIGTNG